MSLRASSGSFQKSGRSESAFSSSRRFSATSQSKTPPQQFGRLLDFFDQVLDVRRHVSSLLFCRVEGLRCTNLLAGSINTAEVFVRDIVLFLLSKFLRLEVLNEWIADIVALVTIARTAA